MKRVAISDDVWAEIARRGKFGETEDDVLRRVFDLKPLPTPRRATGGSPPGRGSLRYATKVMRPRVKGGQLKRQQLLSSSLIPRPSALTPLNAPRSRRICCAAQISSTIGSWKA